MDNRRKPCPPERRAKISAAKTKQISFICDNCGLSGMIKPSHYKRKKNHFCCRKCYGEFVSKRHFSLQNAYRGVRKEGDTKNVYHQNYVKKNPVNISHLKARRYARERDAIGSHTLKQWIDLKESYGNVCAGCGEAVKLTKDHIIPLSKGGSDYIENIQPLCKSCNSRKHNKIHLFEHPNLLSDGK